MRVVDTQARKRQWGIAAPSLVRPRLEANAANPLEWPLAAYIGSFNWQPPRAVVNFAEFPKPHPPRCLGQLVAQGILPPTTASIVHTVHAPPIAALVAALRPSPTADIVKGMGAHSTAALVGDMGGELTGQLVREMGPRLAAQVRDGSAEDRL